MSLELTKSLVEHDYLTTRRKVLLTGAWHRHLKDTHLEVRVFGGKGPNWQLNIKVDDEDRQVWNQLMGALKELVDDRLKDSERRVLEALREKGVEVAGSEKKATGVLPRSRKKKRVGGKKA